MKGYVYGGGALLATQEVYQHTNGSAVRWRHHNPGSTSWVETRADRVYERQEMDALGAEVGTFDPVLLTPVPYYDVHTDAPLFVDGGDPFHLSDGCGDIDGMPASCSEISERLGNGTAVSDSEQWGRRSNGRGGLENYVIHAAPVFDQSRSNLNVLDSAWVPDYNDASGDYVNEKGDVVGVISGRFVSTGVSRFTTSLTPSNPYGSGKNLKSSDKYISNFYKEYKNDLDRCAREVFKNDYSKIKDRLGRNKRPMIDANTFTRADISEWTGRPDAGATVAYNTGKYGTIIIARELFGTMSDDLKQRVYAHELGNLLSMMLTHGDAYAYGDPDGIQGDKDTGAKFEKCLYGSLAPMVSP